MSGKPLNLILLGPPGAGKGTQAQLLIEEFQLPYIATGDILRSAIKHQTPLGLEVKALIDNGNFVSDELIIGVVKERLSLPDTKHGFILDGFPRTLFQAQELAEHLASLGEVITRALVLEIDDEAVVKRLSGRRVNPESGRTYHIDNDPPQTEGVCDDDGTALVQRPDDSPETIRHRLAVYHRETAAVVEFYDNLQLLIRFDALEAPETTFSHIRTILNHRNK